MTTLADAQEYQVPVARSRRPHNAVALITDGDVDRALKRLKKQMSDDGVTGRLRDRSSLFRYYTPGERRRQKARAARARAFRRARLRARRDAELPGTRRMGR